MGVALSKGGVGSTRIASGSDPVESAAGRNVMGNEPTTVNEARLSGIVVDFTRVASGSAAAPSAIGGMNQLEWLAVASMMQRGLR